MSMVSDAKEAAILKLLDGYSGLKATDAFIDELLRALEPYSVEAVVFACDDFRHNRVPDHKPQYVVTAAQLAGRASLHHREPQSAERLISYPIGADPPPGTEPLGPIEVDFGDRRINLRGVPSPVKEYVMKHQRMPEPDEAAKLLGQKPKRLAHG